MNGMYVTVTGNVASTPKQRTIANGVEVCEFRLATTSGRYDRSAGKWIDDEAIFLDVTCWRRLAANVYDSIEKGHPIVLHGRMTNRPYEARGFLRDCLHIEAVTVGHDLTRGVTEFEKVAWSDRTTDRTRNRGAERDDDQRRAEDEAMDIEADEDGSESADDERVLERAA